MPEGVKATRRYDSTRRREQAAATRLEILEAAQRLFERDGYVATTMAAVAAEAGVALKTVYLGFETKAGLLRALWHLRLRGDEADVPIAERQWYRDVIAEPDPERQLRLGAHNARLVKERAAKLMRVMRDAAAAPTPTAPRCGAGSRTTSSPTSVPSSTPSRPREPSLPHSTPRAPPTSSGP